MAGSVVSIQINGELNESVHFKPTDDHLRGTLIIKRDPILARSNMAGLPSIPGEIVTVDVENRTTLIHDPAGDDPSLGDALMAYCRGRGFEPPTHAKPDRLTENVKGDTLATWLHWMNRMVKAGHAVRLSGQFPEELPGKPTQYFHQDVGAAEPANV